MVWLWLHQKTVKTGPQKPLVENTKNKELLVIVNKNGHHGQGSFALETLRFLGDRNHISLEIMFTP